MFDEAHLLGIRKTLPFGFVRISGALELCYSCSLQIVGLPTWKCITALRHVHEDATLGRFSRRVDHAAVRHAVHECLLMLSIVSFSLSKHPLESCASTADSIAEPLSFRPA